jgi:hypothetical protein
MLRVKGDEYIVIGDVYVPGIGVVRAEKSLQEGRKV